MGDGAVGIYIVKMGIKQQSMFRVKICDYGHKPVIRALAPSPCWRRRFCAIVLVLINWLDPTPWGDDPCPDNASACTFLETLHNHVLLF
jgi:hypothetical protein